MHGLEIITRSNSVNPPQPHPLRLHPRIYALRRSIQGMAVSSEYVSRLYAALYKYADQIVEHPCCAHAEGWNDLEALQQVTLGNWMEESIRRYDGD